MGEIEDVGRRIGMSMTILAFGALAGPPISGAIISARGFEAAGYYAGTYICLTVHQG
jgi:MCP family monocarboxylic acid transporter-like MFS transporter 10